MRKLLFAVLTTALVATACGSDTPTAVPRSDGSRSSASETVAASPSPSSTTVPESWLQHPPAIVVSGGTQRLELHAHTWCLAASGHGTCADGVPPDPLPDLGEVGSFVLSFPSPEFKVSVFAASSLPQGDCTELLEAAAAKTKEGWLVRIPGPAGRYVVQLQVKVPGGELDTAFAMTSTENSPWLEPEGTLLGFTGGYQPGDPIGWTSPSTLRLQHLGGELRPGRGQLRMSGAEHAIVLPLKGEDHQCDRSIDFPWTPPEGTLEAVLGNPPYDIDITVEIDGQLHTAHAEWPRDQTPYDETALAFEPPLPRR